MRHIFRYLIFHDVKGLKQALPEFVFLFPPSKGYISLSELLRCIFSYGKEFLMLWRFSCHFKTRSGYGMEENTQIFLYFNESLWRWWRIICNRLKYNMIEDFVKLNLQFSSLHRNFLTVFWTNKNNQEIKLISEITRNWKFWYLEMILNFKSSIVALHFLSF